MAANTIGAITFDAMRGRPVHRATRVELRDTPGEDGTTSRDIGSKAPVVRIETDEFAATIAAADTQIAAYRALRGTQVSIIDAFNITHTLCLVVGVDARPVAVWHAGSAKILLRATWVIQSDQTD